MTRGISRREELLFYQCALRGFTFDNALKSGPLVGIRRSEEWVDTIHIEGIDRHCLAWRQRVGSGELPVFRIEGDAETVMVEAINWGSIRVCSGEGPLYDLG